MLLSAMLVLSFTLMFLNHPLSMGMVLIIQALIVAMVAGYTLTSFLFSYIILIIMLSGALVLFIYMASVASNEKFKSPIKMMMLYGTIIPCIMYAMTKVSMFMSHSYIISESSDVISLIKMFNTMTAKITLIMIIYLLMTMIVVSNIAKVNQGPLRIKM
uniref:NADH dehydrogenase subunit 6 n=1 Tax=Dolycoris baccarum TaxID=387771 RepID=A0A0U1WKH9_DOLBA|nr:NADH dehydrogenase subunit 6 [Dolycoris baccarum]